jgi:hypothetical protein
MIITDLTYKIVANSEISDFNTDDCVDWAIEMVGVGNETEHILILAGLTKPTNYFETIKYLKTALSECGLSEKTGEDGIASYAFYYIKQIANSINVRANLAKVFKYNIETNYDKSVYDFYLLYWAWGDFDWGNTTQEYWPEATKDNIEKIVVDQAKKWISNNENRYGLK